MLTIRHEQMLALGRSRLMSIGNGMKPQLRAALDASGTPMSEDDLDRFIERGMEHGCRYFRKEADLGRYLLLLLQPAVWDGREHPEPVLQLLEPTALEGAARLTNVERWLQRRSGSGRVR